MKNKDARIYVSSVKNISKRLEHYGDASLENISLLKLLYKYAKFSSTYSQLQRFDKMVSTLQKTDQHICLEKQANAGSVHSSPLGNISINDGGNVAPVVSDLGMTVVNQDVTISKSIIVSAYSDNEGTEASLMVIKTIPGNGDLFFNGIEVTVGQVIDLRQSIVYFRFARNSDSAYNTSFTFTLYDGDAQLALESNVATFTFTVEAIELENEPATVGNRTIYSDNRTTTTFTSADFTSKAVAAYSDPEGDQLNAIIIRSVSTSNSGIYYFYGSVLTVGQVITKLELDAGALYHVAADSNAISTDGFTAAIRDEGSMIWVE